MTLSRHLSQADFPDWETNKRHIFANTYTLKVL